VGYSVVHTIYLTPLGLQSSVILFPTPHLELINMAFVASCSKHANAIYPLTCAPCPPARIQDNSPRTLHLFPPHVPLIYPLVNPIPNLNAPVTMMLSIHSTSLAAQASTAAPVAPAPFGHRHLITPITLPSLLFYPP
jgi:hypothetical protein